MRWILEDWHTLIPEPWSTISLIFAAMACGLIVGAERERKEKPAGLRTMTLVCVGAAVFTMLSVIVAGSQGDRGRIASQVVSGIGFLGAGAILRERGGVRGMTTAATIWSVAATGMVVGAGYPLPAIALSAAILAVLTLQKILERRYLGPCRFAGGEVVFEAAGGLNATRVEDILDEFEVSRKSRRKSQDSADTVRVRFRYCAEHRNHKEFLARLAELSGMREMRTDQDLE